MKTQRLHLFSLGAMCSREGGGSWHLSISSPVCYESFYFWTPIFPSFSTTPSPPFPSSPCPFLLLLLHFQSFTTLGWLFKIETEGYGKRAKEDTAKSSPFMWRGQTWTWVLYMAKQHTIRVSFPSSFCFMSYTGLSKAPPKSRSEVWSGAPTVTFSSHNLPYLWPRTAGDRTPGDRTPAKV